ncbi:MAG: DUF4149 domain-containing protein [Sulfurimonadaceae bacterium]|nr:DUF4149 domain-containing protein [Sulfurimonadaceae bacterium]
MRTNIYLDFGYLVVLAATFGAVMTLGVIVAPVVFNPNNYLVEVILDRYNSGMIMAEIFRRFSTWLYFVAAYVLIYEALWYKKGQRDGITLISGFVVVFTSLMFSGVYVHKILAMQAIGPEATMSDTFANTHLASEIDFKILAVGLLVLFIRRVMLLRRA